MLNQGKPLKKLASCALCCLAAAAAVAGPPSGTSGGLLGRASGLLAAPPSHSSPASHLDFQRLDLRPPETLSGGRAFAPGDAQGAFPSAKRAPSTTGADDLPAVSNLGTLRMESNLHELVRHAPHEGLPVARLWETKSALLHVGLSPRGKPGLWLIQKLP
jgi:hypothetical protein